MQDLSQIAPPVHHEVQEFFLSWIQSMLRTGYYDAQHPESRKAMSRLYDGFRRAVGNEGEITFTVVTSRDQIDVVVDGLPGGSQPLRTVLPSGMAELYIPKVQEYFDKRRLSAITIKADVNRVELENFVFLLNQFHPNETLEQQQTRLADTFEQNGIRNIRLLYREELIGTQRNLSFRANLALTRLSKDLHNLPLLQNASPEEYARIKRLTWHDILRPLTDPRFLHEIAINLDLMEEALADVPGINPRQDLLENINPEMLPQLCQIFLKRIPLLLNPPPYLEPGAVEHESQMTSLFFPDVALRFGAEASEEHPELLDQLLREEVITLQDLPLPVQQSAVMRQWAQHYKADPDHFLAKLNPALRTQFLQQAADMVIWLVSHKEPEPAIRLLNDLRWLQLTGSGSGEDALAGAALEKAAEYPGFNHIAGWYTSLKKEQREKVSSDLVSLGRIGLRILIGALKDSEDKFARRHLIDVLSQQGADVVPLLLEEFGKGDLQWFHIRNFIDILGAINAHGAVEAIAGYLSHPEPRVRLDALKAYAAIMGEQVLPAVRAAVRDPDERVREQALKTYAGMTTGDPEVNGTIKLILGDHGANSNPKIKLLTAKALVNKKMGFMGAYEEFIAAELAKAERGALTTFIKGKAEENPPELRAVLAEVLGNIGTRKSEKALADAAKDKNPDVAKAAAKAHHLLRKRLGL